MNYAQFRKIITLLEDTSKVVGKASKYVQESIFNKHNLLISTLLESIYESDAITYILYEWLTGNKSELNVTLEDGTKIVYPLDTMEDLYKVMEMYKADPLTKHEKYDKVTE